MKVQLVKIPITELQKVDQWYMPLELISLANAMQGVADVEILDGTHLSKEDIINNIDADIVGISYTSLSSRNIKEISDIAKRKGSFVIFGGQAATAKPNDLFNIPETDVVIVHAGEYSLRKIIENNLKNLEEIPNLYYRQNGQVIKTEIRKESLENYGILDRAIGRLNIEDYIEKYPSTTTFPHLKLIRPTNIFSQKGCPRSCSFCARQDKEHLSRKPEEIVEEIKELKNKYKIDYLFDVSDTWAKDLSWIKKFQEVYSNQPKIPMTVFADIRDITKEKLEIMKEIGIDHILYGVESGSDTILKLNGKPYTKQNIKKIISETINSGIKVSTSFVIGLIGENTNTLSETQELISNISWENVHTYVNVIIPLPGSKLWSEFTKDTRMKKKYANSLEYDLESVRKDFLQRHTDLTLSKLIDFRDKINHEAGLEKMLEYAR